jgi:hypothetical protein
VGEIENICLAVPNERRALVDILTDVVQLMQRGAVARQQVPACFFRRR